MGVEPNKISFHKQYISLLIVVLNIIVFVILQIVPNQRMFIEEFAVIPYEIIKGKRSLTIFLALFIHINYLHLITNMSVFYIVGYKVEKEIGHILFLIIYFVSGICGFLLHVTVNLFNMNLINIRLFGASGAIFGILGFYLIIFFNKIYQNINLSHLFFYILIHLIFMTAVLVHFGGFITGLMFAFIFKLIKDDYSKKVSKKTVNWSSLGHAYLSNDMFEHALHNLKFAIKMNPHDITALMDLGFCYQKLDNFNEAIKTYKQILEVDPNNNLALYNIARVYFKVEHYNEALYVCNESLKINANFKDALDLQKKIFWKTSHRVSKTTHK